MPHPTDLSLRRLQAEHHLLTLRLHRELERRQDEELRRAGITDMTAARATAMMVLFQAKRPLTATQLAQRLGVSSVTVARFVQALERDGWVRRDSDPQDGRALRLQPTGKAHATLPKFVELSNRFFDSIYEDRSQASLLRANRALVRRLEALGARVDET